LHRQPGVTSFSRRISNEYRPDRPSRHRKRRQEPWRTSRGYLPPSVPHSSAPAGDLTQEIVERTLRPLGLGQEIVELRAAFDVFGGGQQLLEASALIAFQADPKCRQDRLV